MDGENNGKAYEQMDDLGGTPILGNTHIIVLFILSLEKKTQGMAA